MFKVGIIGAGELGRALGHILTESSNSSLIYWDRKEERLAGLPTTSLAELLEQSDFIFYCLPAPSLREALACSAGYWRRDKVAVFFSKGLDPQTGKMAYELGAKMLPRGSSLVVISGSMIAEELAVGRLGLALISGSKQESVRQVKDVFAETKLWLAVCDSTIALSWAGVLKNLYALGLGDLSSRSESKNEQGFYFAQALLEMNFLIKKLTRKNNFMLHPELLADFWATAGSKDSVNYRFGLLLGNNQKPTHFCEAYSSYRMVAERLNKWLTEAPLLNEIVQKLEKFDESLAQ